MSVNLFLYFLALVPIVIMAIVALSFLYLAMKGVFKGLFIHREPTAWVLLGAVIYIFWGLWGLNYLLII